ncbi:MAG: hypothetical protein K2Y01_01515 [Rhabdochlamydiaceae bacterium]|nr:hypothetical protein [Rhabdochlamydiaceae bacterium]
MSIELRRLAASNAGRQNINMDLEASKNGVVESRVNKVYSGTIEGVESPSGMILFPVNSGKTSPTSESTSKSSSEILV